MLFRSEMMKIGPKKYKEQKRAIKRLGFQVALGNKTQTFLEEKLDAKEKEAEAHKKESETRKKELDVKAKEAEAHKKEADAKAKIREEL